MDCVSVTFVFIAHRRTELNGESGLELLFGSGILCGLNYLHVFDFSGMHFWDMSLCKAFYSGSIEMKSSIHIVAMHS
jgi:hypothetical protein